MTPKEQIEKQFGEIPIAEKTAILVSLLLSAKHEMIVKRNQLAAELKLAEQNLEELNSSIKSL